MSEPSYFRWDGETNTENWPALLAPQSILGTQAERMYLLLNKPHSHLYYVQFDLAIGAVRCFLLWVLIGQYKTQSLATIGWRNQVEGCEGSQSLWAVFCGQARPGYLAQMMRKFCHLEIFSNKLPTTTNHNKGCRSISQWLIEKISRWQNLRYIWVRYPDLGCPKKRPLV